MSDQDTPPPMDDENSEQDVPPPMESEPEKKEESVMDSIPMDPPSAAGIGLGQGKMDEKDEMTMALLCHLLGGITSIVAPLIIWVLKKEESPFVDDQGREAVNFQLTILVGFVAAFVIAMIPVIGCFAALLYPVVGAVSLIFAIIAGVESNKGTVYRYPFALRLIS